MDLNDCLLYVFPNKNEEKYTKMLENLKKIGIDSASDLKYLDDEAIKELESFNRIEIKKLKDYLEDPENGVHYDGLITDRKFQYSKNLRGVFKHIFMNTPDDRLSEIENILKKEQIYSGSDMMIVDTNALRKKNSLVDIEILKIEDFIKENNRERYNDMKAVKMAEEERQFARLKLEDERQFARLKLEDEIKFFSLKQTEELKFMQLKAQKLTEFESGRVRLYRGKETELIKAKAKMLTESENIKVERQKEIMEARTMEEKIRKDMKLQREKMLIEAELNEEMEREYMKNQRKKQMNARDAKAKDSSENSLTELAMMQSNSWKHYMDTIPGLESEIFNPKILLDVLNNIFFGVEEGRKLNIEKILRGENVISGMDMLFLNTNDLRRKKSLAESEILKIEDYIRKNNRERYDELREQRTMTEVMKHFQFETDKYINEQRCLALTEERNVLLNDVSWLERENVQLNKRMTEVATKRSILGKSGYHELRVKRYHKELDEIKIKLDAKNERMSEIDQGLEKLKNRKHETL